MINDPVDGKMSQYDLAQCRWVSGHLGLANRNDFDDNGELKCPTDGKYTTERDRQLNRKPLTTRFD
ncbi:MAG: hypothetical protein F6K50_02625 [Moorea sp. SIO3I7]|nr:hypothetical protein [Moorena sp. SIO3I7]